MSDTPKGTGMWSKLKDGVKGVLGLSDPKPEEKEDDKELDSSLPPLEQVKRYSKSSEVVHRLQIVRELLDTAKIVGYEETKKTILPLFRKFKMDSEPIIKQDIVKQVPEFLLFIKQNNEEDYKELAMSLFLPLVTELTLDDTSKTRVAACDVLVELAKMSVDDEIMKETIKSTIKSLARDKTVEDHRVNAASLFNRTAKFWGKKTCEEFTLPYISTMADDPTFQVRRAVANNLKDILETLGPELASEMVLPVFLKLCKDNIWGVRKVCAENLVEVSKGIDSESRTALVSVFETLIDDASRWVKIAAFQILGPFIATFDQGKVDPKLVDFFTGKGVETKQDTDATLYRAYNFPAVLLTVGKEHWETLQPTFDNLAKNLQYKVRRTLAFSLHEIAKILGTELTEKYLLSHFHMFLKDLEEVRVGVINSISHFLEVLSPEMRHEQLPLVQELLKADSSHKWRPRKSIAKQVHRLVKIYSAEDIEEVLMPLIYALLNDEIEAVRSAFCKTIGKIYVRLTEEDCKELREKFKASLIELSKRDSYQYRQVFVKACGSIKEEVSWGVFKEDFLEALLRLANDPVPNVRLRVAELLSQHLIQHKEKEVPAPIKKELELLLKDEDSDVFYYANLHTGKPFVRPKKNPKATPISVVVVNTSSGPKAPSAVATTPHDEKGEAEEKEEKEEAAEEKTKEAAEEQPEKAVVAATADEQASQDSSEETTEETSSTAEEEAKQEEEEKEEGKPKEETETVKKAEEEEEEKKEQEEGAAYSPPSQHKSEDEADVAASGEQPVKKEESEEKKEEEEKEAGDATVEDGSDTGETTASPSPAQEATTPAQQSETKDVSVDTSEDEKESGEKATEGSQEKEDSAVVSDTDTSSTST